MDQGDLPFRLRLLAVGVGEPRVVLDDPAAEIESNPDRGADLAKALPVGSDVDVVIQDIDPAGRRIRVSRRAVALQREQAELRDYAARQDSAATGSIGSLADKLRGALGNKTK